MITEQNRYRGALLGLACGDAIGAAAHGKARGSFAELTDMPGSPEAGAGNGAAPALGLADSLLQAGGFDADDQLQRCAGASTSAGAALARLAPVPMYYALDAGAVLSYAAESTRVTHAEPDAIESARLFGLQLREALLGHNKEAVLSVAYPGALSPQLQGIADNAYRSKSVDEIRAGDASAAALEAALWCFWHTSSYKQAVLQAANLGEQSATVAAICGQLAGAYYGVADIPEAWLDQLAQEQEIISLADRLLAERLAGKTTAA